MKIDPKLRERFSEGTSDEEIIRTTIKRRWANCDISDDSIEHTVQRYMRHGDDLVLTINGLASIKRGEKK